jgi:isopenicillin N synthase-like dioxygenase
MIIYQPPSVPTRVPVVDLTDATSPELAKRKAVAWEIHKACRETGFFYVIGHGVSDDLMAGQLASSKQFFDLSEEEKRRVHIEHSAGRRGYEPSAIQALDEGAPPDLKESYLSTALDAPDDLQDEENLWPDLPGFRAQNIAYGREMVRLGRLLASSLALSLELSEDYFSEPLKQPNCTVRLLKYPPHPQHARFNQLGSGAHTDWGMITILLQDDVGGLEVRTVDGAWIAAPPIPSSFVINLGDMVPEVTEGLYTSNYHRVRNNDTHRDRFSVATFFNPPADYVFDTAPTCRKAGYTPNPRTFGDHIKRMFERTYRQSA